MGHFNFLWTVTEFLILMKILVQPVTWEVDFGSEVNSSKNNGALCKSVHFKLVFFALATDELTSKASEILYRTQNFRSSSRPAWFTKKKSYKSRSVSAGFSACWL